MRVGVTVSLGRLSPNFVCVAVAQGSRERKYWAGHNTGPPNTILVVEDNEDNRIIYSTVLRHVGYDVVEAVDGAQTIALARSARPDLILMDISIPEVNGWEAPRIRRRDTATRGIPLIELTAQ